MAKKEIGAKITLRDNMTATLKGIRKEQSQFRKDVQETRKALEKAYKKKQDIRINNSAAMKAIKETRKAMEPFRKAMVLNMAYKDMISAKLRKTKNELMNLGRMVISPVVKIKDLATEVLGRIRAGLSTIALPVGVATAAGTAALGAAIASGARLEQQQVAMEHFIGINSKGKSASEIKSIRDKYLNELRRNANYTPFETGEVIAAGMRAVNISHGDPKKAMEFVKLAEDMAALTPGKTLEQAIEALADLKVGETARMQEFGFKLTQKQIQALGGFDKAIEKKLKPFFAGGAKKLSETGIGLWSTIKGNVGTIVQDFGYNLLEKLKPAMKKVIEIIDRWSPKITEKLNKAVDSGYQYIKRRYIDNPDFQKLDFKGKVKFVFDDLTSGIEKWLKGGGQQTLNNIGKTVGEYIATGLDLATPKIAEASLKIGSTIGQGILDGVKGSPLASSLIGALLGFRLAGPWGALGLGGLGFIASIPESKPIVIPKGHVDLRRVYPEKLPKNARGTNFWRGGLTWVGENGPELVNLPRGSQVIPNNKVQNYTNKGGNNITININGYNKSTREIMNELVPQLKLALANM